MSTASLEELTQRVHREYQLRRSRFRLDYHSSGLDTDYINRWAAYWSNRHDYSPDEWPLMLACRIYVIARDKGLEAAMLFKLENG